MTKSNLKLIACTISNTEGQLIYASDSTITMSQNTTIQTITNNSPKNEIIFMDGVTWIGD